MTHLHAETASDFLSRPIPEDLLGGLPVACGRIAGALESLLAFPESQAVRDLAQQAFDSYQEWYERAVPSKRKES